MLHNDNSYYGQEGNGELAYRGKQRRFGAAKKMLEASQPLSAEDEYVNYLRNLSHLSATSLEHHIK